EARARAGKVQGRRTTRADGHPLEVPAGEWAATLRTTWIEPAYLELDASWCVPGGEPATPLANGGAFGGKVESPAAAAARALAVGRDGGSEGVGRPRRGPGVVRSAARRDHAPFVLHRRRPYGARMGDVRIAGGRRRRRAPRSDDSLLRHPSRPRHAAGRRRDRG